MVKMAHRPLLHELNEPVEQALNSHLSKFQMFLEKLKDDVDCEIKDSVISAVARTSYNDDFDPILSRMSTVFITVIGAADWNATRPLMSFLDYIFNAHRELEFHQYQLEKINQRRKQLLTYLIKSKIEIPLSQLFRKLRNYEMAQDLDSDNDGARLQAFFKYRRRWRKKPGGEPLRRSLAKMDALIRKFDDEWPQMDEELLLVASSSSEESTSSRDASPIRGSIVLNASHPLPTAATLAASHNIPQEFQAKLANNTRLPPPPPMPPSRLPPSAAAAIRKTVAPPPLPPLSHRSRVPSGASSMERVASSQQALVTALPGAQSDGSRSPPLLAPPVPHTDTPLLNGVVDPAVPRTVREDSQDTEFTPLDSMDEDLEISPIRPKKAIIRQDSADEVDGARLDVELDRRFKGLGQDLKDTKPDPSESEMDLSSSGDELHTSPRIITKTLKTPKSRHKSGGSSSIPADDTEDDDELDTKSKFDIALDTDDLRLQFTRTHGQQYDFVKEFSVATGMQTEVSHALDAAVQVNIEKPGLESETRDTQTDISVFSSSTYEQNKYHTTISLDILQSVLDLMRSRKTTDYSIKFSFCEAPTTEHICYPDNNSIISDVIPDIVTHFPGTMIVADQEVHYEVHKVIVYTFSNTLRQWIDEEDADPEDRGGGASLTWSDYEGLVAGCALIYFFYDRRIMFNKIHQLAMNIWQFRHKRMYDPNSDTQQENHHTIFLKILQKLIDIGAKLDIEYLKVPLSELPSLMQILGRSKNDKDWFKLYQYNIIGTQLSGPSIQKQKNFRELSLDSPTPTRPNFTDTVSSRASSTVNESLHRFVVQQPPTTPAAMSLKKKKKKKEKQKDPPTPVVTATVTPEAKGDKKRKFSATDSSAFDGAFGNRANSRLMSSSQATHQSKGKVITKIVLPPKETAVVPPVMNDDPFAEPYIQPEPTSQPEEPPPPQVPSNRKRHRSRDEPPPKPPSNSSTITIATTTPVKKKSKKETVPRKKHSNTVIIDTSEESDDEDLAPVRNKKLKKDKKQTPKSTGKRSTPQKLKVVRGQAPSEQQKTKSAEKRTSDNVKEVSKIAPGAKFGITTFPPKSSLKVVHQISENSEEVGLEKPTNSDVADKVVQGKPVDSGNETLKSSLSEDKIGIAKLIDNMSAKAIEQKHQKSQKKQPQKTPKKDIKKVEEQPHAKEEKLSAKERSEKVKKMFAASRRDAAVKSGNVELPPSEATPPTMNGDAQNAMEGSLDERVIQVSAQSERSASAEKLDSIDEAVAAASVSGESLEQRESEIKPSEPASPMHVEAPGDTDTAEMITDEPLQDISDEEMGPGTDPVEDEQFLEKLESTMLGADCMKTEQDSEAQKKIQETFESIKTLEKRISRSPERATIQESSTPPQVLASPVKILEQVGVTPAPPAPMTPPSKSMGKLADLPSFGSVNVSAESSALDISKIRPSPVDAKPALEILDKHEIKSETVTPADNSATEEMSSESKPNVPLTAAIDMASIAQSIVAKTKEEMKSKSPETVTPTESAASPMEAVVKPSTPSSESPKVQRKGRGRQLRKDISAELSSEPPEQSKSAQKNRGRSKKPPPKQLPQTVSDTSTAETEIKTEEIKVEVPAKKSGPKTVAQVKGGKGRRTKANLAEMLQSSISGNLPPSEKLITRESPVQQSSRSGCSSGERRGTPQPVSPSHDDTDSPENSPVIIAKNLYTNKSSLSIIEGAQSKIRGHFGFIEFHKRAVWEPKHNLKHRRSIFEGSSNGES